MSQIHVTSVGLSQEGKSPYWVAQWAMSDGKRVKKSTKVPVAGGLFRGEKLTRAQAKNRALMVAQELANAAAVESVRELFDKMLGGKLGRVSTATYNNAKTSYRFFCEWFGKRADAPARLVSRADIKEWVLARRKDVRHKTVLHEAFTPEEIHVLLAKLPDEWAAAVRCCLGSYGQRLGDVRSLRWEQFDWQERVVRMTTGKTGRVMRQPMLDGFFLWARSRYEVAMAASGDAERDAKRAEMEAAADKQSVLAENVPYEEDIPLIREEESSAKYVRTVREFRKDAPKEPMVLSKDEALNILLLLLTSSGLRQNTYGKDETRKESTKTVI